MTKQPLTGVTQEIPIIDFIADGAAGYSVCEAIQAGIEVYEKANDINTMIKTFTSSLAITQNGSVPGKLPVSVERFRRSRGKAVPGWSSGSGDGRACRLREHREFRPGANHWTGDLIGVVDVDPSSGRLGRRTRGQSIVR
jgi:hypothetical protein